MDNLDDSENNAKISDSAYSNSCSNSQSRRSHSSKSTHSGSHSSGSSGYGGKPSTPGYGNNLAQLPDKRNKEKEPKKKKHNPVEPLVVDITKEKDCRTQEADSVNQISSEEIQDAAQTPTTALVQSQKCAETMDTTISRNMGQEEIGSCSTPAPNDSCSVVSRPCMSYCSDGFSCVISMHDGVVIYTTSSLTTSIGFPKHMWIGRSFIDFVHPRDRNTFASQITNGLAVPKNVNGMQEEVPTMANSVSTMVCRIRRYRGLTSGFGVKERMVTYIPFLLKLSFKNITDEEGKVIYLVIQATQFVSAFKTPNETVTNPIPFEIRHAANGNLEYIDPESVPYLGYLPQDVADKDALQLYHPDDLSYLRQVYENIVKEGGVPRSMPYRIMAQNGDYVKVETEWSSFINPWSKKLEFVIGKHYIVEGPTNPDVLHTQNVETTLKLSEEEKIKAQSLRERIVRIMNDVLTKPAEMAKQNVSKRCQDLATFIESLIEEQPKPDEELRIDIQEPDNSYYERDSVMLGGISPHHEYSDSKSSTETPLSYNQLNYNENLQRYFDSHQPYSYDDYNTVTGENILGLKYSKTASGTHLSPLAQYSADSGEMSVCESSGLVSSCSPALSPGDYQTVRLTESLLNKHNSVMEKELMKMHREYRSSSRLDREKASNETRLKKMEHLARCNTLLQPAAAEPLVTDSQPHGVKRAQQELEAGTHKHHCSTPRQSRCKPSSVAPALHSSTITTTVAASHWSANLVNSMNTFILDVGVPQQMSMISPMMAVPAMFPLYYTPAAGPSLVPSTSINSAGQANKMQFQHPAIQCQMYGQAVYGSPFMFSPIDPPRPYPLQDNLMEQTLQFSATMNQSMSTSKTNREPKPPGTNKSNLIFKSKLHHGSIWRDKKRAESQTSSSKTGHGRTNSVCSINASSQSAEGLTKASPMNCTAKQRLGNSEEAIDRTDGESSYSSFYSSFFKTDSDSAEERSSAKKVGDRNTNTSDMDTTTTYFEPQKGKKMARRKMQPPWMDQVRVTSELVYKYQIFTKSLDEVLSADKQKMDSLEQPSLVNDQLSQLYLDLQLEGVAATLALEEGITSCSSSGEENSTPLSKVPRRKREVSELVMFYEEDSPLPPPMEQQPKCPTPLPTTLSS